MQHQEILLQIPGLPEYVSVVRKAVGGLATQLDFSSEQVSDIKLAVGEACNNAVKYNTGGSSHVVRVKCKIRPASLQIEVRNNYSGEPPAGQLGCSPRPESFTEGGMGIYLMKKLVDHVDIRWEKSTAIVCLTKNLPKSQG